MIDLRNLLLSDWLLVISLIGGLFGIISFIHLFWRRIVRTLFPIRVEIEPLELTPSEGISRTISEREERKYCYYLRSLDLKIVNKGFWFTYPRYNWFINSIKNCYVNASIIGVEDIPNDLWEKLSWKDTLPTKERHKLYVFDGTKDEYAGKLNEKFTRKTVHIGFGEDESKVLHLLWMLSDHEIAYFAMEHKWQVRIPKTFRVKLVLHGENVRKSLTYEVNLTSSNKVTVTPIDC